MEQVLSNEAAAPHLPLELIQHIHLFLPTGYKPTSRLVCKEWRELIPRSNYNAISESLIVHGDARLLGRGQMPLTGELGVTAAKYGRTDILKWMQWRGVPFTRETVLASILGNIETFNFLQAVCPDDEMFMVAAMNGKLDVLKRWSVAIPRKGLRLCTAAAGAGHLDVIKWVRSAGGGWGPEVYSAAAGSGHTAIITHLRSKRVVCPWDFTAFNGPIEKGREDMIDLLVDVGCPVDDRMYDFAVNGGHTGMIPKLLNMNLRPAANKIARSGEDGRHKALDWLFNFVGDDVYDSSWLAKAAQYLYLEPCNLSGLKSDSAEIDWPARPWLEPPSNGVFNLMQHINMVTRRTTTTWSDVKHNPLWFARIGAWMLQGGTSVHQ